MNDNDLFGKAILDWLADNSNDLLYTERDDGLISPDSISHYFYWGENNIKGYQKKILTYIKDPILDLGCGPGRFTNYLINKGHKVVGIDISYGALWACKHKSRVKTDLAQMSLLNLGFIHDYFKSILIMGHTIGAVGDYQQLTKLLGLLRRITTEDANILLTSVDVDKLRDEKEKKYFIDRNYSHGKIGHQKMRLRYKKSIGPWFDWLFIPPNILKKAATENGWQIMKFIFDENRPDRYASVLIKKQKYVI